MIVTIKDVAKEAKVAVGTVSKYLNQIPIGEPYRLRVEEAISRLGYQVNTYARGLKAGKTKTVALILPDVRQPFFAEFSYYAEAELNRSNYKMYLCSSGGARGREVEYINMAKQSKVDGIIAITYSDIDEDVSEGVPFISLDRHFSKTIPCVTADNYNGGKMAAEKLIECGCRRLVFLRIGSFVYGEADRRRDGFIDCCKEYGLTPDILILYDDLDNLEDSFKAYITKHCKDSKLGFDGLFAATDRIALRAIQIMESLNIHVPEDLQVIGFDGIQRFNDMGYFVSTIRQPIQQMAETCVRYLLKEDRSSIPPLTVLPVEYKFGGTTKF